MHLRFSTWPHPCLRDLADSPLEACIGLIRITIDVEATAMAVLSGQGLGSDVAAVTVTTPAGIELPVHAKKGVCLSKNRSSLRATS